ncbi:hypothetical protein XENTR_v10015008 [Xenopus tropicalis]|uniref:Syndecan n=1 Tax=Xenopus tropicalis TaxID=8364 RepID=A0A803JF35_XENTR|nr:syndecan-1 [Xenopus tropicalis]KAE8605180.1 hypothetical protein XENTR_v10015008 [Xenopus tropicalis]
MDKLLVALYLLGVCCSVAIMDEVRSSPLDDLEASGDDEDFISGSGIEDFEVDDTVPSTSVLPSVLIFAPENTSPQPNLDEKDAAVEHTTIEVATTKSNEDPIEELVEPVVVVGVGHDVTTHKPTTHRPTTVKSTAGPLESSTEQNHHPHHHHPHHHHHHTTTTKPTTAKDQLEDNSDSPSGEDKSYVHYIHHKVTTTSPPDNEEPDVQIPDQDSPSGSSSTPYMEYEETTEDPSGARIFIGHDETATTKPSENEEDDGMFEGHHEKPTTTSSSNEAGSHVQHDHHKTTSSPSHHVEPDVEVHHSTTAADLNKHHHHHHHHHPHHHTTPETTTSVDKNIPHHVDDSTTPADLNKHHHHHHHHHPPTTPETTTSVDEEIPPHVDDSKAPTDLDKHHHHHHHHPHHHTTTESTTSTTSDTKHADEVPVEVGKGRMAHGASATSAVPVLDEEVNIPDLVDLSTGNNSAVLEEGETDSKEGESSGEENFFFVNREVIQKGTAPPINRMINTDGAEKESSPDASHGIMERKEVLAGIIAGGVAGLAFAVFLVGFMLYRMKKKDEGSYSLDEPKQSNGGYQKPREQREFYA